MYLFLLLILLTTACEEKSNAYIINTAPGALSYKSNFKSLNPGEEEYSILLSWSSYPIDLIDYNIYYYSINNQQYSFNTILSDSMIQIDNLTPGSFYGMEMHISPGLSYSLISFTKPLSTISWKTDELGNYGVSPSFDGLENKLLWEEISDTNIQILNIYVYNSVNNYPNNINEPSWQQISTLESSISEYTHQKDSFTDNYCYLIISLDQYENTGNSIIVCDDHYVPSALPPNINIESISSTFSDKILIELNAYEESDFSYYILWRSLENTMSNIEKIQIAESINPLQLHIDDRYNVYDKIYYYQVEIISQYGISNFGNIVQGSTLP